MGDSSYTLFSYQYDSQDRLTTITNADGDVTVNEYSSAGQVTTVTDPNSNKTTYSYDAMNRETGMTNAAGTAIAGITTYVYDEGGNQITETDADRMKPRPRPMTRWTGSRRSRMPTTARRHTLIQ